MAAGPISTPSTVLEQKYRILLEITNAIVSNLTLEALFKAITHELQKVTTFDRTGITLYDPASDQFQLYLLETTAPPVSLKRGADIPRVGSGMGWAFDHGELLYRASLPDSHRFYETEHFLAEGLHSVAYFPLITHGKTLGTFQVASRSALRYSADDLDFLAQVAKQLALVLDNALAYEEVRALQDQLHKENVYLREEIKTSCNFEEIIGDSPVVRSVLQRVESVAGTDASVLITGETGTGKELIARAIHQFSRRKARPLIKVNCAALPAGLIESELFGYEKGAFTGALAKKIGRFELAHRGTIFLDEVGDLSAETQAKLLRVLQEQEFERVGGTHTIRVDTRVIAATNRDLTESVARNLFRADLYYRLNVFPVRVPPLRERKNDISILARYFMNRYAKSMGKPIEAVSPETLARLTDYEWPGNVRELENVIERAVILCRGPVLELEEDSLARVAGATPSPPPLTLEELERDHIVKTLLKTNWVIGGESGAAKLLNLHPNTLRSRLAKLRIKRPV